MKQESRDFSDGLSDDALKLLAGELRRLACDLARGISKKRILPSLSNLAAMRPLEAMLFNALSTRVSAIPTTKEEDGQGFTSEESFPGYV